MYIPIKRFDAQVWIADNHEMIMGKFSALKQMYGDMIDDETIIEVLTTHCILVYLDEYPGPIFDVYEAFDSEDLEKIVYGELASAEDTSSDTEQHPGDTDVTSELSLPGEESCVLLDHSEGHGEAYADQ